MPSVFVKIPVYLVLILMLGCDEETLKQVGAEAQSETAVSLTQIQISSPSSQVFTDLQFQATARYSDGTLDDITSSVSWNSSAESNASIDSSGYVTPLAVGNTNISASLNGITSNSSTIAVMDSLVCGHTLGTHYSNAVNDLDPSNAAGSCIKIAEDSIGNWFTGAPSVAAVDAIDFTILEYTEYESSAPVGLFIRANWFAARAWCETLNDFKFAGRSNWQMPTENQLLGLYGDYGSMRTAFGWATGYVYHSQTFTAGAYVDVGLNAGGTSPADTSSRLYPSCVST